jgi:SAM-dependent methyltransferase
MNKRDNCNVCGYRLHKERMNTYIFGCIVRHFKNEQFSVWRCPICNTIHCLDIVDLDKYYARYFYENQELEFPYTLFYRNLLKQLKKAGLTKESKFLDYGCANGQFVTYLKQKGYAACYGYDPYSQHEELRNKVILRESSFDFILLQDVIEHIEDPRELLSELYDMLETGGVLFIGTPNADRISLKKPADFINEVHVPYHLHIYGKKGLQELCEKQGFRFVRFFDRSYLDIPLIGLNERSQKVYQELMGGSIDDVMGEVNYSKLIAPKYLLYAFCGYILGHKANMGLVVVKEDIH